MKIEIEINFFNPTSPLSALDELGIRVELIRVLNRCIEDEAVRHTSGTNNVASLTTILDEQIRIMDALLSKALDMFIYQPSPELSETPQPVHEARTLTTADSQTSG